MRLGVNVDHAAALREARGTEYPDPVEAALFSEEAGCDSIVVHLRKDRRHIKEKDIALIKKAANIPINLEMSIDRNVVSFAVDIVPGQATLVPERRNEITTEGGMDLRDKTSSIEKVINKLKSKGVKVSLFIDPLKRQIDLAKRIGADIIEINTGKFSEAKSDSRKKRLADKIKDAAQYAKSKGLYVAAGHGIDYKNAVDIIKIQEVEELNIGHSIMSRALFIGIVNAVKEMLDLIRRNRL